MIFFCLISSFREENSHSRHSVWPCGVNVRFWLETFHPPFSIRSISSQIFFFCSFVKASQEESLPCFNGAGTDRIMLHISEIPYIRHCIVLCMPLGPGKTLAPVADLKPEPPTHLLRTLTAAGKVTLFKFYLGHKNSCCVPPLSDPCH